MIETILNHGAFHEQINQLLIQWPAQLVGFIALFLGVWSFSQKNDQRLKIMMGFYCIVLATHYYLLGAFVGAAVVIITALRGFLSAWRRVPRPFAFLFVVFYFIFGFYNYSVWLDLLPIVSSSCSAVALFYLKGILMRLVLIASTTCFIIYNISVGSIGPTIMEFFIWGANALTIWRLYCDRQLDQSIARREI